MNRRILVIFAAFMAVAMLATPVFAVGPFNAVGNNPNLELEGNVCDMEMGAGTKSSNRWFDSNYAGNNAYLGRDFTQYRAAVKEDVDGEIKGAEVVLTIWVAPPPVGNVFFLKLAFNADLAAQYENKWIYMSSDYLYNWFKLGIPEPDAYNFAYVQWPYGVYYRYLDVT